MPTTTKRPTKRMHDLADAVARLTADYGYAPTLREVAAVIGTNVPRAHAIAHAARDRGLVEFKDGAARTIRVVEKTSGRKHRGA